MHEGATSYYTAFCLASAAFYLHIDRAYLTSTEPTSRSLHLKKILSATALPLLSLPRATGPTQSPPSSPSATRQTPWLRLASQATTWNTLPAEKWLPGYNEQASLMTTSSF